MNKALFGTLCVSASSLALFLLFFGTRMIYSSLPPLVTDLFPRTPEELTQKVDAAIQKAQSAVEVLCAINPEQRTFDNTFGALDSISNAFSQVQSTVHAVQMVSPDQTLRDKAAAEILKMQTFAIDALMHNEKIYEACKAYMAREPRELLTPEQDFFCTETMRDFKRIGFDLPVDVRKKLIEKEKELMQVQLAFDTAINTERPTIAVDESELAGLDPLFIAALEKSSENKRRLTTDYAVVTAVLESCTVSATREKLWRAYVRIAYPMNEKNLAQMILLRDECARILGYESAAVLDCESGMAKSPDRVEAFLADLTKKSQAKLEQELIPLKQNLPAGVTLDADGKFYPWDWAFVKAQYKQKNYALDEQKIAEYFPAESTLAGLLAIYEEFFACMFTPLATQAESFWDPSVRLIKAERKNGELLGYLLLDLYPRPAKYGHACQMTLIPGVTNKAGERQPAVALVIANFPTGSEERPALLKHNDVVTFFHEFGHAVHTLLSAPTLSSFSGTRVKRDFVELPSQMLEEWMYDPAMIKKVSRHYKTGEALPDSLIEQLCAARLIDRGDWLLRQLSYSELSLACYGAGSVKDIVQIKRDLAARYRPHIASVADEHGECSFGHLTGYGAMYYSYLWSKVFALDLFKTIEKSGLLNPIIGTRYAETILAPGGSRDPEDLLRDFLGRAPRTDEFFASMGI